jgi:hypothetical protein
MRPTLHPCINSGTLRLELCLNSAAARSRTPSVQRGMASCRLSTRCPRRMRVRHSAGWAAAPQSTFPPISGVSLAMSSLVMGASSLVSSAGRITVTDLIDDSVVTNVGVDLDEWTENGNRDPDGGGWRLASGVADDGAVLLTRTGEEAWFVLPVGSLSVGEAARIEADRDYPYQVLAGISLSVAGTTVYQARTTGEAAPSVPKSIVIVEAFTKSGRTEVGRTEFFQYDNGFYGECYSNFQHAGTLFHVGFRVCI